MGAGVSEDGECNYCHGVGSYFVNTGRGPHHPEREVLCEECGGSGMVLVIPEQLERA